MKRCHLFPGTKPVFQTLLFGLAWLAPSVAQAYPQLEDIFTKWQAMQESKAESFKRFNDAKFGMFIHWGLYSVPSGKWDGEKIPGSGDWIFHHAKIPRKDYRALGEAFNPTKFNADAVVKLAKAVGMRYIVAMPKHHDGFAMYDSAVSDYDIIDATPFGRDPIQELYDACQEEGLEFGIYYSHATDWMDGGDAGVADHLAEHPDESCQIDQWPANTWDPAPVSFADYIEKKAKPQMRELLERFPNLLQVWYDTPRYLSKWQSFQFYKLTFDLQPQCLINSGVGNGLGDYWVPGDNRIPDAEDGRDVTWETPGTLNNSFGFKSYDNDWKTTNELLFWILDIASKGGNYLLNIGPRGDGSIPHEGVQNLLRVGDWMRANGEAIYGTEPWLVQREGPTHVEMKGTISRERDGFEVEFTSRDIWFTQRESYIYASGIVTPRDGRVEIEALGRGSEHAPESIRYVSVLGYHGTVNWEQTDEMLTVELPAAVQSLRGFSLRIAY